ncbi:MAG TPA: metallophosphoesterase family protein [Acidimicrobiia bacterium]|nr:metallophosphoesterase family protein [Acidimicrobiia bacterium]
MTEIVVLADTHIRRGSSRRLPAAVYDALAGADLVLHAGDVVTGALLEELAGFAPTVAVLGNNDGELVGELPEDRVLTVDGLRIAMIHDSGARKGREARLRRRFPTADLVVFGHSHMPVDATGIDGQHLFNPGSPTEKRAYTPHLSFGRLRIDGGRLLDHRIVEV